LGEPRDLYDLWHLLEEGHVNLRELRSEIAGKLAFRGRSGAATVAALAAKESRLQTLWTARLAHQMAALPPFEEVFRGVRRGIREAQTKE